MAFNLDLAVLIRGRRRGAAAALWPQTESRIAGLRFDMSSLSDQQQRDFAAFVNTGWQFDANGDPLEDAAPAHGLLARHADSLVIVRDRIVVGFEMDFDGSKIVAAYPDAKPLSFGMNLYEFRFDLPQKDLLDVIGSIEDDLMAAAKGAVRFVEPVIVYHVGPISTLAPVDVDDQWQWKAIGLREAWKTGDDKKGDDILVAVIDQGFFEHPTQLKPQVHIRAYIDEDGTAIEEDLPQETHGTFCASLIGARDDDDEDGLGHGAAPHCGLMLVALTDCVSSKGMGAALSLCAKEGARVISCSLGPSGGQWDKLDTVVDAIRAIQPVEGDSRGVVVVWAVSNNPQEIPDKSLERHEPILCVGSSNSREERVPAAYGHGLDLLAPGEAVGGIYCADGIDYSSKGQTGTSYAAACVAGVAALILSVNNNLRWNEVVDIIINSCDPLDQNKKWDPKIGWGRLNALRAVESILKV
jgi:subtilisin family serine protease